MNKTPSNFVRSTRRRGSIYIAVLGVSLIVATLAAGGIIASRIQARDISAGSDMAEAQLYARSGLELARLWISQDANWRTNRTNGDWGSAMTLGNGSFTVNVVDPLDANLANRPHDPVTITVTGAKGTARHMTSMTLNASALPISSLGYPLHSAGELLVKTTRIVYAGTSVLSTNANLNNAGRIEGAVEATSITTAGVVFGGVTTGTAARTMPASSATALYTALATPITLSGSFDKRLLSSGSNPWGAVNPDGVYIINSATDITISNSRIYGTLIVNCPGKKVTLSGDVLIEPGRPDFPSLIVIGDLWVQSNGGPGTTLCETDLNCNFNPTNSPYQGATDNDVLDDYPDEILSLIHI